jgi:hypothetical protein
MMRNWMTAAAMGAALLAACGREPTAARTPQLPRLDVLPLSATIKGPTTVQNGYTCLWYAMPSGGTPPYRYFWSAWSFQTGSDSTFEATVNTSGAKTLYLTVWDANDTEYTIGEAISNTTAFIGCPNS